MDEKLVASFQAFFKAKGEDVSAEAAEGSIAMWMKGEGEMNSELAASDIDLWQPVIDAYESARPFEPEKAAE